MKHILLVLLLISSLFSFEWSAEYDEALVKAKKENKGIYVFVGTANCPFCDKLKETTFADEEVIKELEKEYELIYLSIDIDDIPKDFKLRFYPAHYFVNSDGKIIYSTAGYRNKEYFLELLKDVKEFQ